MKKTDKTARVLPRQESTDPSPKKRESLQKTWKEQAAKLKDALNYVEQQLNLFLIENFSLVLQTGFEPTVYHGRVLQLLDELKCSQLDVLNGIFEKLKSVVKPLISPTKPVAKKQQLPQQHDQQLQADLRAQSLQLTTLREENLKLRSAVYLQAERNEQNRKKQNRMTQLLYILRKKNIDIDRIYEQNCQTPSISKKTSALEQDLQPFEFEA